jgi:hypothetical protein
MLKMTTKFQDHAVTKCNDRINFEGLTYQKKDMRSYQGAGVWVAM